MSFKKSEFFFQKKLTYAKKKYGMGMRGMVIRKTKERERDATD